MPEFSVEAKFAPPQGASAVESSLSELNALQVKAQGAARELAGANQLLSKEWSAAGRAAGLTAGEIKGLVKAEQLSVDEAKAMASAEMEAQAATKGLKQSAAETADGITQMATGMQAAVAALGVQQIAATTAELYNLGAANERVHASTDLLTGGHADDYIRALGEASRGTLDDEAALASVNELLSTHVSSSAAEMANMTEIAIAMGRTMGVDAAGSVNIMTDALSKASPKALEQIGLLLKQSDIQAEVNRLMSEDASLTASAAQQAAIKNVYIEKGNALLARMGGLQDDAASESEKFAVELDNVRDAAGEMAVNGLQPALHNLNALIDLSGQMTDALNEMERANITTANSFQDFAESTALANAPLQVQMRVAGQLKDKYDDTRQAIVAESIAQDEAARAHANAAVSADDQADSEMSLADQQKAAEEEARRYTQALRDQLTEQQNFAAIAATSAEQLANLGMGYATSRESGEGFLAFLKQSGNDLKEVGPEYDALRASLGLVDQSQIGVEHGLADLDNLLQSNVVSLQQAAQIWDLLTTKQIGAANAAMMAAKAHVDLSDGMSEAEEHQMLLAAHAGDAPDTINEKAPQAGQAIEELGNKAQELSQILTETQSSASQSFAAIGSSAQTAANQISPVRAAVSGLYTDWMALKNNSHIELSVTITQNGSMPAIPDVPGQAAGGMSMGGMTLVGEKGPELVMMPPGAYVRTASETKSDLAGAGGGKGGDVSIINYGPISVYPQVANPSMKEIALAMKDEMV